MPTPLDPRAKPYIFQSSVGGQTAVYCRNIAGRHIRLSGWCKTQAGAMRALTRIQRQLKDA